MQEYFNDPMGAFVSGMVQDIVGGNSSCFPLNITYHGCPYYAGGVTILRSRPNDRHAGKLMAQGVPGPVG